MQIGLLAEHPGFAPTLAQWLLDHWRFALPHDTLDARMARLRDHMRSNGLPMALVAHDEGKLMGTVALRTHELDDRRDLSPWLGGLFVSPRARRQGLGQALCAAAEQQAVKMGVRQLHLFTLDQQAWYARQGWHTLVPCTWQGHQGCIMVKTLAGPAPAAPAAC